MSEGELAGMGWIWVVAVTVRLQLQPNGPVSGKPTIRPCDGIQAGKRSGSYFYAAGY